MASDPGIEVTVRDLWTGETQRRVIVDDYVLVCAGRCHEAHTQVHENGTHIITIKGRRRVRDQEASG